MGICGSTNAVVSQPTHAPVNFHADKPKVDKNTNQSTSDDHHLVPAHHTDKYGHEVDNHTGGRVFSEAYYEARNEAAKQARLRGECYEQSKKAYSSGQKADAKHLSDEGKKHEALMEKANERAVHEILAPQHLKEADVIDLHGLHVTEAVLAMQQYIECQQGRRKVVEVVTGVGHHSDPRKGPVLRPAILKLCEEKGWKIEKHAHNEGSFTVFVPP